jgi:hypothetical protein
VAYIYFESKELLIMSALISFAATLLTSFTLSTAGVNADRFHKADVKAADARVRNALEQLKIPFIIDDDGDFNSELKVDKGRTQNVLIYSTTQKLGHLEMREIASAAYRIEGDLDAKVAQRLLASNAQLKVGAWQLDLGKGNVHYAVLSVKIPANASPQEMEDAISVVMYGADRLEQELSAKDNF